MRLTALAGSVLVTGIWLGLETVAWADSVLSRTSLYREPRAALLDSLLGPEEDFEFVDATTPRTPPTFS